MRAGYVRRFNPSVVTGGMGGGGLAVGTAAENDLLYNRPNKSTYPVPATWDKTKMSDYAGVPGDPTHPVNYSKYMQLKVIKKQQHIDVEHVSGLTLIGRVARDMSVMFPWEHSQWVGQNQEGIGLVPVLASIAGGAALIAGGVLLTGALAPGAAAETAVASVAVAPEAGGELVAEQFAQNLIPATIATMPEATVAAVAPASFAGVTLQSAQATLAKTVAGMAVTKVVGSVVGAPVKTGASDAQTQANMAAQLQAQQAQSATSPGLLLAGALLLVKLLA